MKQTKLVLALAAAGMLMVGCGGGGSSGGTTGGGTTTTSLTGSTKYGSVPTAAIKITPTNAPNVLNDAMSSLSILNKSGSAAPVKSAGASNTSAVSIVQREVQRMQTTKFKSLPSGVMPAPATINCQGGGTMLMSYTDINGNGALDSGDGASVSYAACNDGFGTVQSGAMSMVFTTIPTTATSPTVLSITFNDFSSASAVETTYIDGDMTMSMTTAASGAMSMTISGKLISMKSSIDGVFQMANYKITDNTDPTTGATSSSISMTLAGDGMQGSVTLTIQDSNGVGTIRVAGAGGSYAEVSTTDGITCNLTVSDGASVTGPTAGTCASFGV